LIQEHTALDQNAVSRQGLPLGGLKLASTTVKTAPNLRTNKPDFASGFEAFIQKHVALDHSTVSRQGLPLGGLKLASTAGKIAPNLNTKKPDFAGGFEAFSQKHTALDHSTVSRQGLPLGGLKLASTAGKIAPNLSTNKPNCASGFEALIQEHVVLDHSTVTVNACYLASRKLQTLIQLTAHQGNGPNQAAIRQGQVVRQHCSTQVQVFRNEGARQLYTPLMHRCPLIATQRKKSQQVGTNGVVWARLMG
jgi:hypothetical protein